MVGAQRAFTIPGAQGKVYSRRIFHHLLVVVPVGIAAVVFLSLMWPTLANLQGLVILFGGLCDRICHCSVAIQPPFWVLGRLPNRRPRTVATLRLYFALLPILLSCQSTVMGCLSE